MRRRADCSRPSFWARWRTLRRVAPDALVLLGLAAAALGAVVLLAIRDAGALFAGALLAGAGLSAVFPTAVAVFTERGGVHAARLAGWVFATAALGGATIPWAVGWASAYFHSLRAAMAVLQVCIMIMIAAQLYLGVAARVRSQPECVYDNEREGI